MTRRANLSLGTPASTSFNDETASHAAKPIKIKKEGLVFKKEAATHLAGKSTNQRDDNMATATDKGNMGNM